ncbi:helix-turn-helix transcriptional regulator, partial [Eubacterium sp.]
MGKRIIKRRKQLGLSQEQLAELADVSPQMISTAER